MDSDGWSVMKRLDMPALLMFSSPAKLASALLFPMSKLPPPFEVRLLKAVTLAKF